MRVLPIFRAFWLLLPTSALHAQAQEGDSLRLGPGDRIRVEVAGDSVLSGDFDVDSEGTVLVPLIGLTAAVNLPFGEVARDIVDGFNRELVDPLVRVIPLLRVSVLGEVRIPGLYWVDPTMTLAEVLAGSGGPTDSVTNATNSSGPAEGTGVFFSTPCVGDLVAAVRRFEQLEFDPDDVVASAQSFGKARFIDEMRVEVDRVLSAWPRRVDGTMSAAAQQSDAELRTT